MDLASSVYPVASILFLRVAMWLFESWAVTGRSTRIVAGVACMGLAIDAGARLFAASMTSPYWWFTPLVVFAFGYVAVRAFARTWKRLSPPPRPADLAAD